MKKFWNNLKETFFPSPSKDLTKIVKDCEFRIFESYVGNEKIDTENIAFVTASLLSVVKKRLKELQEKQQNDANKTENSIQYLEHLIDKN